MENLGIHENNKRGIELAEKLHQVNPYNALDKIKKTKHTRAYAWRKRDGKTKMWVKVYKDHPPKDPFYSR